MAMKMFQMKWQPTFTSVSISIEIIATIACTTVAPNEIMTVVVTPSIGS